jgi:carbon monoxide dehydrogenase subunit G
MRITGTATLGADRAAVWRALNDPAVLVHAIPGCRTLQAVGEDAYAMTVSAGVGAIKGMYDGQVRLSDQQEPASFRLHAQGSGAPGTIGADVDVHLEEGPDGGTSLTYDAEATVGGMIGGVGQRMLVGVSRRMASEFFGNVDGLLAPGAAAQLDAGSAAPTPSDGAALRLAPGPATAAASSSLQPAAGTVFTAASSAPSAAGAAGFARGVTVGAVAALAGAVVGAWIARRAGRRG